MNCANKSRYQYGFSPRATSWRSFLVIYSYVKHLLFTQRKQRLVLYFYIMILLPMETIRKYNAIFFINVFSNCGYRNDKIYHYTTFNCFYAILKMTNDRWWLFIFCTYLQQLIQGGNISVLLDKEVLQNETSEVTVLYLLLFEIIQHYHFKCFLVGVMKMFLKISHNYFFNEMVIIIIK